MNAKRETNRVSSDSREDRDNARPGQSGKGPWEKAGLKLGFEGSGERS